MPAELTLTIPDELMSDLDALSLLHPIAMVWGAIAADRANRQAVAD